MNMLTSCTACVEKVIAQEHEEEFCCHDCSKMFLRDDMDKWSPYGRDLVQGDEPIYICLDCSIEDKHQERIVRYERYMEEEYGPGGRSLISLD